MQTFGGTPGTSDSLLPGVVINEILANFSGSVSDSIELFNPTAVTQVETCLNSKSQAVRC